jgi:hypothetical protein
MALRRRCRREARLDFEQKTAPKKTIKHLFFMNFYTSSSRLEVSFLRAYQKIVGRSSMDPATGLQTAVVKQTLDGYHVDHVSIPMTFTFDQKGPATASHALLPQDMPAAEYVVGLQTNTTMRFPKFKLLTLASC